MDNFDPQDYKILLNAILRQAMDDYIKLQHPKLRRKKYLQEAFDNAVDMFFDSDFRLLSIQNDQGEHMSLKELLTEIMDDDRVKLNKLQEHLIKEARSFWETKIVNTLYIPDSFLYDGHVYSITHHNNDVPEIDFHTKIIKIDKDHLATDNQEAFLQVALKIMLYHEDIPMSQKNISILGKGIFKMLRINGCFTG